MSKIALFLLSSFVCGLSALLFPACDQSPTPAKGSQTLTIISPHGSDIRREFAEAFSKWHQQNHGTPVHVVWPDVGGGGTGNIIRALDAAYANADSAGYDLAFGGGSATFGTYANKGYLIPVPPLANSETDPIKNVPPNIFGGPLHGKDKEGREVWVAATMSAFGMAINKQRITELKLPTPRVWEDISKPEWFGHLSLADPSKAGSVKTSFEMVLQEKKWAPGWAVITRMFANATLIRDNGGAPADDVSSAEAVAGIVIDFYGRLAALRAGSSIVGFVIPEGGTIVDADPIAMLKGAPQPELAARFIRFVVSPEGQKIWILRAGTPGGPRKSSLGRLSVLKDLYTSEAPSLFDPGNPFEPGSGGALAFSADAQSKRNAFIGDLIKSALIDNHSALIRARRAIKAAGDRPELLAKLEALPSFRTPRVENGTLIYGDMKIIADDQQAAVAAILNSKKVDPLFDFLERIQNTMRDDWRKEFAARFAEIAASAAR